ncbi:MAG: hypothetical protein H0V01_05400 [Bacteroidetes bacterium]|nr:hypothetical protein [Bacteroidota bacterium]HET6243644.1 hypothetical protein [Bacteroidia bacterium]
MKKYWFLILFSLLIKPVFSQQNPAGFIAMEAEMKDYARLILNSKSEEEKYKANLALTGLLEKAFSKPESFNYAFDSLVTIARIIAPDNTFRLFNWHLAKADGTFEYFGYIQPNPFLNPKKISKPFYKLKDTGDLLLSAENKSFSYSEWPGAHYYKMIHVKDKKNKHYILLGWNGNNSYSTKKIIDVLFFSSNGEPKFGAPVFKMEKKIQKRVIFEYAKDVTMSLKYQEQGQQIIFDHLAPNNQQLKGQYQYYGPDLSFDALIYKKGIWVYFEDFDAKNSKSKKDKNWQNPK